jgi:hypothetical protein
MSPRVEAAARRNAGGAPAAGIMDGARYIEPAGRA